MLKLVLGLLLVLSFPNANANDDMAGDQLSNLENYAPDFFSGPNAKCIEWEKARQCMSPGTCQAFSANTLFIMTQIASRAGYKFFGSWVGLQLATFTAEYCKKPNCFVGTRCLRWIAI
jgi:hypothetical protein